MVADWWVLILELGVAGSIATIGSLNVQWWFQDRSEKVLGLTGLLCWTVALALVVAATGVIFPVLKSNRAIFSVQTAMMGVIAGLFLATLAATVRLPATRAAVVAALAAPALLVVAGLTGDYAYVFIDGSPWPHMTPFGTVLQMCSPLLVAAYSVIAMRALRGARRWQLAGAIVVAEALVVLGVFSGPSTLSDALGSLVTAPIAILLAWWCSARVLTLQGSLLHAEAGWQRAEHIAEFAARHDELTGLPNQLAATDALQEMIDSAGDDERVMVAIIQINGLDRVLATAGAQTAHHAVKKIADHILSVSPAGTVKARLGESTFLMTRPQGSGRTQSYLEAKVLFLVRSFQVIADLPPELTFVTGIAVATETSTASELLQQARIALTAADQEGQLMQLYRHELRETIVGRARTARLLTAALDRDEFELHYQPVFDTFSGQRTSVEALVRWRHHGRLHSPAEWIPIAEQHHLMSQIGLKVLQIAVRDHAALGCPIAVNVSPQQFNEPDFAATVLAAIGSCPPAGVILEVTESSMMDDPIRAADALERLRHRGIRISLDDFGTEYSSLSRLATMPFDIVKIDQSFVSRILTVDGRAMVTAIHAMARALGKVTVAEGVETVEERQAVREIGCDFIQGFLTGRPVPLSELTNGPPAGKRPSVLSRPTHLVASVHDTHAGGPAARSPDDRP